MGLAFNTWAKGKEKHRFMYQGQFAEHDEESGFSNFELRLYDPVIVRWLSVDPYGEFASPYLAMGNNPAAVDPDGGCITCISPVAIHQLVAQAVMASNTIMLATVDITARLGPNGAIYGGAIAGVFASSGYELEILKGKATRSFGKPPVVNRINPPNYGFDDPNIRNVYYRRPIESVGGSGGAGSVSPQNNTAIRPAVHITPPAAFGLLDVGVAVNAIFAAGIDIGTRANQRPSYWGAGDFTKASKMGNGIARRLSAIGATVSIYQAFDNPTPGNVTDAVFATVGLIPGYGTIIGGVYFGIDLLTLGITGQDLSSHIDGYMSLIH